MLPKSNRVPKNVSFEKALFFQTPFFSLRALQNNLSFSRYGFVISKKVSMQAVIRNRIRRQMSSYIESKWQDKLLGWDVLFIVRKASVGQTTETFGDQIEDILRRLP